MTTEKKEQKNQHEWIAWYVEHGGSSDLKLHPAESILFHPEHGFLTYLIDKEESILEIHHMCGDGKFWQKVLIETVMKEHNLKTIRAFTRRNPKAWIRKYGGHIRGYYMEADIDEIKI